MSSTRSHFDNSVMILNVGGEAIGTLEAPWSSFTKINPLAHNWYLEYGIDGDWTIVGIASWPETRLAARDPAVALEKYKALRHEKGSEFDIIPMNFSSRSYSDCGHTIIHACRYRKSIYDEDDDNEKYDPNRIFLVTAPNEPFAANPADSSARAHEHTSGIGNVGAGTEDATAAASSSGV